MTFQISWTVTWQWSRKTKPHRLSTSWEG